MRGLCRKVWKFESSRGHQGGFDVKAWMIVVKKRRYDSNTKKYVEREEFHGSSNNWRGNVANVYLNESSCNKAMATSGYNYMGDYRVKIEVEIPDLPLP